MIARCLAHHDYSPVHIPTHKDEQVKEFIRMRDDHRLALKKINVAKTAVARELACFIWGMMTEHYA